ncbi:MAG: hypothetical protein FJX64_10750 [Alphaproteobacteria bacterium]|nr:hypothetical protein [Alphaproteobacteria bacterium]
MRKPIPSILRAAGALLATLFVAFAVSSASAQVATDRSVGVFFTGANEEGAHEATTQWTPISRVIRREADIRVADDALMEAAAGKKMTPQEAAAALKVRFVLTGAITAGSHAFKFELKLFDGKDGKELWAATFLSDEDNIGTVPTEISGQLVPRLKAAAL